MMLWFEFSIAIAWAAHHYGTFALGIEGEMMSVVFGIILYGILETITEVEDQLTHWAQWICRGLSMICTLLFAFGVARLVVVEVLFVLKYLCIFMALWGMWLHGDLIIRPDLTVWLVSRT